MSGHTPGPWDVSRVGYETYVRQGIFSDGDTSIAHVYQAFGCLEANAALIAAAPDLLAAATDVFEVMADTGYYNLFKKQLDALRAAIAKAEGTSSAS